MKSGFLNLIFNDKWVLTSKDVKLEHLEEECKILYNNEQVYKDFWGIYDITR